MLSRIRAKTVGLVINLNGAEPADAQGNYLLRRAACDFAVPLMTNLNLVAAFADAVEENVRRPLAGLSPQTLFDHYAKEKSSDAWTSPTEFH